MKLKLFEPRCKHRHTKAEHPQCFPRETKSGDNLPKILILDVETSLMEAYVWGLRNLDFIPPTNVIKDFFILSWSAKFLFSPTVYGLAVTPEEAIARKDGRILSELWRLLDVADIVIAHNGKRFDFRKINTRLILNGFAPPNPYEVIDTYQVAKSIFGFSSNALGYLNLILGLNLKSPNIGIDLWIQASKGNQKALTDMLTYNMNDVTILEELYLQLRPWIRTHPNAGLYMETTTPVCRVCGSGKLTIEGTMRTPTGKYDAFRCNDCGAVGRMRTNVLTKLQRKNLTR